MDARLLTLLILLPFTVAFIWAGIHEYLRYKDRGKATYGLAYDEETGTTHVTGIGEDEEGFDMADFDPEDFRDPEITYDDDDTKRT